MAYINSNRSNGGIVAIITVVIVALISSWMALSALMGNTLAYQLNLGLAIGSVPIKIDGLSAWFLLIVNFTSITGAFYGLGYLKGYSNPSAKLNLHWIMFAIFHLSMVLVCIVQNGFVFLVIWEIMSLSSAMLVMFDGHNPKTLKAGINYLVQMHISIVFLTIGFIWLYATTGSFNFDSLQPFFIGNNNIWLFLVFFAGFGLKAGFIPLHSWLPHAHPSAPSHVSGVMSGVIVKMGIYGIIRVASYLTNNHLLLGEIVISISILTGIYGILNAAAHRDFKRMLAYCTIENIGIIGIGIGVGLVGIGIKSDILYFLGFGGALLHVLNHSLFKSLLFYSAGSIYQQTHTRDMDKLGGLSKYMPKTAFLFLIGAVAIAGLPPFNGFVSEFIIYSGLVNGFGIGDNGLTILLILSFAGLSIIGGLSLLTFTKTYGVIFSGTPRTSLDHKPHEVSNLMIVPQLAIIAAMLSVAFLPSFYVNTINSIIKDFSNGLAINPTFSNDFSDTLKSIMVFSLAVFAVILVVWGIRKMVTRNKSILADETWGCGYTNPTPRIQYTGKSFSKQLGKIFNFFLIEKKKYNELSSGEIFPQKREYSSFYTDFFETRFINLVTQRILFTANYFRFIQNGRIQTYVLYGIVFILAIFILSALNLFSV
ncbi:hydrogenase [Tenuifilaceae bacterium CYCD]|nr:hydrogenase [Tenuifilaceae bacterium CYCD]